MNQDDAEEVRVSQLPTIHDVARIAGVSRQTVSNVINAPEVVRTGTRERVEAAIRELGYRPHASARRLRMRARTSSALGVRLDPLPHGVSGAVHDRFLHALTESAAGRGMRIMLYTADDPLREIEELRDLRNRADVDAFVLIGDSRDDPRVEWLERERIPFVSFGRPWGAPRMDDPGRLWVDVDGRAGTARATDHLIAGGRRRIGFVGWPSGSRTGDDRRAGWRDAMRAAFPALRDGELDALAVETVDSAGPARMAVEQRIASDPQLDALVCVNDSVALGALMAVREAGRPELPVLGFDNTPVAEAIGLSSVDQRLGDVAAAILELLMGETGQRVLPHASATRDASYRLITPQLVVRRSHHLALAEKAEASAPGHRL